MDRIEASSEPASTAQTRRLSVLFSIDSLAENAGTENYVVEIAERYTRATVAARSTAWR